MLRSGASLIALLALGWVMAKWRHKKPRSLLDNAPLGKFLRELVPLERLPDLIRAGHIQALAITPSQRLDAIAARHVDELPPAVRTMLGCVGVSTNNADIKGDALASFFIQTRWELRKSHGGRSAALSIRLAWMDHNYAARLAQSMTNRYFTSPLSIRS